MKRRVRKIANFFAFNLLFFALYLNFIHKDRMALPVDSNQYSTRNSAFSQSVLVENPEQYLQKKNQGASNDEATVKAKESNDSPSNLTIN